MRLTNRRSVVKSKNRLSYAISDRSGMRYPYNEMMYEPGTNFFIHRSESDGIYNEVDHPQNHIRVKPENYALLDAHPETTQFAPAALQTNEGVVIFTNIGQPIGL